MKNNLVMRYLTITFLITYVSWFGIALMSNYGIMEYGQPLFMVFYVLGGVSPFIAALFTIRQSSEDHRVFKSEILKYRVGIFWYAGTLILPVVVSALSWGLNRLIIGQSGTFSSQPVYMVLALIPSMIIGGGLEEVGWRGIMLPQLLKKTTAVKATAVVAVVWAVWHVPLWFIPGTFQYGSSFLVFVFFVVSLAFILSALYIKTRSILICVLFHATVNAYLGIGLSAWAKDSSSQVINTGVILIAAIVAYLAINRYGKAPKERSLAA